MFLLNFGKKIIFHNYGYDFVRRIYIRRRGEVWNLVIVIYINIINIIIYNITH